MSGTQMNAALETLFLDRLQDDLAKITATLDDAVNGRGDSEMAMASVLEDIEALGREMSALAKRVKVRK